MMKLRILFTVLLCLPVLSWAEGSFLDRLTRIKTLKAHFTQEVRVPAGRVMERTSGEMAVRRPNQLYWLSLTEPKQLIIADGKKLWVYDPDLEQVTVKEQQSYLREAPASLLTGDRDLINKLFKIVQKGEHYTLFPKEKEGYNRIEFDFMGSSSAPHKMVFIDELGQRTTIEFNQVVLNQPIKDERFTFKVPKGVDVVY